MTLGATGLWSPQATQTFVFGVGRGEQGGPASCENADAADGDGNGLSQAEYLQARAR
jgi:hypothetical protein